jgi:diacylglycerol kinase (ATP)
MTKWIKSFRHALNGIKYLFANERNARIELAVAILCIGLGFYFQISRPEWFIVILCIFGVLSLEAINTSLERALDLLHPEENKLIGISKDLAASAVLLASIAAAIIGSIIFYPYVFN